MISMMMIACCCSVHTWCVIHCCFTLRCLACVCLSVSRLSSRSERAIRSVCLDVTSSSSSWQTVLPVRTVHYHGLCGSNKLLYKRWALSMGKGKFRLPTARTFITREREREREDVQCRHGRCQWVWMMHCSQSVSLMWCVMTWQYMYMYSGGMRRQRLWGVNSSWGQRRPRTTYITYNYRYSVTLLVLLPSSLFVDLSVCLIIDNLLQGLSCLLLDYCNDKWMQ